jgi:hypothetical protein
VFDFKTFTATGLDRHYRKKERKKERDKERKKEINKEG